MSKLLEVKKLTKNYHDAPDSRDIIKDLDLTVNQEIFSAYWDRPAAARRR